jgi:hypothetical protein
MMHRDTTCRSSYNFSWCVQGDKFTGGEFMIPEYGVYFVPQDNMIWWFDDSVIHGTAIIACEAGHERIAIGCSIPPRLKSKLARNGIDGLFKLDA